MQTFINDTAEHWELALTNLIKNTLLGAGYTTTYQNFIVAKAPLTKSRIDKLIAVSNKLCSGRIKMISRSVEEVLAEISDKKRAAEALLQTQSNSLFNRLKYRKQNAGLRKAIYTYDIQLKASNTIYAIIRTT